MLELHGIILKKIPSLYIEACFSPLLSLTDEITLIFKNVLSFTEARILLFYTSCLPNDFISYDVNFKKIVEFLYNFN
jgi:hypothetical protein